MSVVRVVNIVPAVRSNETTLNWQPSIAVNPANPDEIVITAYAPPPGNLGYWPVFYSYDRGESWQMNFSVQGELLDQSAGLGTSGELYWAVAYWQKFDSSGTVIELGTPTVYVLRTPDPATAGPLPEFDGRPTVDQPYAHAFSRRRPMLPDKDRLYIGYNDSSQSNQARATVDVCLNPQVPAPTFTKVALNPRCLWDGYEVRPAAHNDGTVYVTYKGCANYDGTNITADVVVARDDDWGAGGFNDLKDPGDKKAGRRVATNVRIRDPQFLGGQRLNNDLFIAVDPTHSTTLYVVWGDNTGSTYTLRVRRSIDSGNTWSGDLLTIGNANLACLAVNSDGRVGFMYQQLVSGRWETHFRRTMDSTGQSWDDVILARTAAAGMVADYSRLIAVDKDFYGVFPAWNTPDPANFPATPPTALNPNGAKFLRNTTNSAPWQLRGTTGLLVTESVDPFFYMVQDEDAPAPPSNLAATPR